MELFLTWAAENIPAVWMISGALFIAFEALGVTGIGFLFAGIGAIITGLCTQLGWIAEENTVLQFCVFFGTSSLSALLLWKPMRRFLEKTSSDEAYHHMVGSLATVIEEPLRKNKRGRVRWSGTIMQALVDPTSSHDEIEPDVEVEITSVKGTTILVKPLGEASAAEPSSS